MELAMQVMIRYKVKPDQVTQNLEQLRVLYDELRATQPDGLRYETFHLDDDASFLAFVDFEGTPGAAPHHRLASFQRHRAALDVICDEPPVVTVLHEVDAYGSTR
jgi:quinol monooxygenase YgiN